MSSPLTPKDRKLRGRYYAVPGGRCSRYPGSLVPAPRLGLAAVGSMGDGYTVHVFSYPLKSLSRAATQQTANGDRTVTSKASRGQKGQRARPL